MKPQVATKGLVFSLLLFWVLVMIVGFVVAVLILAGPGIARIDCGHDCVAGVPEYGSTDVLAYGTYAAFAVAATLPFYFATRKVLYSLLLVVLAIAPWLIVR